MFAFLVLLLDNLIVAEIHNKLKQLIFATTARHNYFNAGISSGCIIDWLILMFLFQVWYHLLL